MTSEPILVDTSCWIEYFNRPGTPSATAVEDAIREDRAALTGVVLAEISQGAKNKEELHHLRASLGAVRYVDTSLELYERAGDIAFELRRRGVTVPITDCMFAAAAESVGGNILTLDGHFMQISEVSELEILPD
ncbi:type II toxin-antitoxin system toxin ribonuclease VapC11 [soil metagenome]